MTTSTLLATLVGNAFGSTPRADAITVAQTYFDTVDGDSNGEDLATAMLAHAILLNQRQAEKGRTDGSIAVLNIDQLVTPEMERLLNKSKASTFYDFITYQQPSSSKHWSMP